jgi:deoxyribonuclease-2
MGNCFGCYQYYTISKNIFQKNKSRINYTTIILKLPHGKTCYQINEQNSSWLYYEDINNQIKKEFSGKYDNWIIYNDEIPNSPQIYSPIPSNYIYSGTAHAKGILAWNENSIKWLIHSVPKFPKEFNGTNQFPDIDQGELEYGQSFVFLTIDISHLNNILKQLFIMHPNIYLSNIENINNINNIKLDQYKDLWKTNNFNIYKINDELNHVAKSPHYHKNLYEDIVIPEFKGKCLTETWIRGHHCSESEQCKMVPKIKWQNGISYSFTRDHSKYCVSDCGWIMIGDMNRMTSQFKRGGGGLVIKNENISKLFNGIICANK